MPQITKFTLIVFVLFFCVQLVGQPKRNIETLGRNSPAVIADKLSISYGFQRGIILELLKIYEVQGLDSLSRHQKVEDLYRKYQSLSEGKSELNEADKATLGITDQRKIEEALDFDIYLSTRGKNSPAVYALGGQVEIWYGISATAFKGIWEALEDQQSKYTDIETILNQQVKRYEELKVELDLYKGFDEVTLKARVLLNEGKIKEAEELLDETAFTEPERIVAFRYYTKGRVKEILLKYAEALEPFELAARIEKNNSEYSFAYANLLYRIGRFDNAINFYGKSIELVSQDSLSQLSTRYNNLGSAYDSKGSYDRAISYYEKALGIDLEIYGEMHPSVAIRYNNLGLAYDSKGSYDRAISYYEKALRIDLEIYGEMHPDIAIDYNNLGLAYFKKGAYDRATIYYEKALGIDLEIYGEMHPSVAIRYNNLGGAYSKKGSYDRAIIYYEKALGIDLEIYGEMHPDIAIDYNNLGLAYFKKGAYDRATIYYEKALGIDLEIYGEMHPSVATRYNNLGGAYSKKGSYDLAIIYYEKALGIDLEIYGEMHPEVAIRYNNLATDGCISP